MKNVKTKPEDYQVKLLDAAEEAMEKAYNPYSHFYVGAALLTADGKIITGANYENASYGNTICAERAALLKANAEGYRRFKAIAIIAKGENFDVDKPTAPCGACRQSIFEASQLSDFDIEVIMSNTKRDVIIIKKISELLPLAFGPLDLEVDIERYKGIKR
ncbi:MAG: cytidine deaminase [Candidatus Micrarchaeia archaeon]